MQAKTRKICFTIIVPFYNKEKTLESCLRSLIAQDFPKDSYEIVAVNNNSTDRSVSVIKKYPSVKLIHEKQQGAYVARNSGIRLAGGAFVVFTDADVEVERTWLSEIHREIDKNDYDILIGWYVPTRQVRLIQLHSLMVSQKIKKAIEENCPSMLIASACNMVVKKEVMESEKKFRLDSNSEDIFFAVRCMKKRYRIGFSDAIQVRKSDINSIAIYLVKNFIYGCSSARIEYKLPILLKYASSTVRFIFKHFPVAAGTLLFTLSYFMGYSLVKSRFLKSEDLPRIVYNYTKFASRRGL